MLSKYPECEGLDVSCSIEDKNEATSAAYRAIPKLVEACQAQVLAGEESIFSVMNRAEEWIADSWPDYLPAKQPDKGTSPCEKRVSTPTTALLGRRLIYSHHIISKIKRGDIHNLASHYRLTGYMKIGWPGIVLIEGLDENCNSFYDEIRPWSWKFLVVRGEQQERVKDLNSSRKFIDFVETNDMSLVAKHCREAGLEALFRTSMKVYDHSESEETGVDSDEDVSYGALVRVDHMNNAKGYRKWLRKTAKEVNCFLLLKQSYLNDDFTKRPLIIVAIVGKQLHVQQFLKRWRTSRVDIDSKGKPCLERMVTVLVEGNLDSASSNCDNCINVSLIQLHAFVESIGGSKWKEALMDLVHIDCDV